MEAGRLSCRGKGAGGGDRGGQAAVLGTTSPCAFLRGFLQVPHANERSEKVSGLCAGLVRISQLLHGNSVKRFSLVSQVLCGPTLELAESLR